MLKNDILKMLEQNRGEFISGEKLAETFDVSRGGVWKVIRALKFDGYNILAQTNKGYKLSLNDDKLSVFAIEKALESDLFKGRIEVFETLNSTNIEAKARANQGEKNAVIISETQVGGRGRLERSFLSLPGGIYMSVLVTRKIQAEKSVLITIATAVAVFESILEVTGKKTAIKWVNDLFYEGKKVVGILTEGDIDMETRNLNYAVIGIGVNFCGKEFEKPLSDTATHLYSSPQNKVTRNELIAKILNKIEYYLDNFEKKEFLDIYRENLFIKNREVEVIASDSSYFATAKDIDDEGRLILEKDGVIVHLNSDEIRVKV